MANTLQLVDVQPGDRVTVYLFKPALSGNYTQASRGTNTGELLVPSGASNPSFIARPAAGAAGYLRGYPYQGPVGYGCEILPGADAQHWLLRLFSAANTEVAAGAYSSVAPGATADPDFLIAFEAKNYQ